MRSDLARAALLVERVLPKVREACELAAPLLELQEQVIRSFDDENGKPTNPDSVRELLPALTPFGQFDTAAYAISATLRPLVEVAPVVVDFGVAAPRL